MRHLRRLGLGTLAAVGLFVATVCAQQFGDQLVRRLCVGSALSTCNTVRQGSGSPESSVSGLIGDLFLRSDGGIGTGAYIKERGTSTTGWQPLGVVKSVTLTPLTNAQIKALPTTAITIVAAPGSGLAFHFVGARILCKCSAGAYTNVNTAATLVLQTANGVPLSQYVVNDTTTNPVLTRLTDFLRAANSTQDLLAYSESIANSMAGSAQWVVPANPTSALSTDYVNQALVVAISNGGSGNLTGGNAANTLPITVLYTVEAQ